jgi:hypothetical protein
VNIVSRSKIDLWLLGAIVLVPVLILEFIAGDSGVNQYRVDLLTLLIVIIVLGGIGGLYATTHYTITSDMLLVRSGPFAWVIRCAKLHASSRRATPPPVRRSRWIA